MLNAVDDSVIKNSNRITRLPNKRDIFSVVMGYSYVYISRQIEPGKYRELGGINDSRGTNTV